MSELSFVEKLLDGVEVEWKALGEILVSNTGGGTPSKAKPDYWNGEIPWASVGDLSIESHCIEKTRSCITSEGLKDSSSNLISKGDLIVAVKISPGKMKIAGVDLAINQDLRGLKLKDEVLVKFMYYYFQTLTFQGNGTIVKAITSRDIEKTSVPIPCPGNPGKSLEIQSEIVRILDAFTALTAELTAELTARKKQYNYYRDQLLSFKEGEVEWKSLEDIASFRRGSFPQPYGNNEWYDGEDCMPFVQVADVTDSGFRLHESTKQKISKLAQSKSVYVEAGTVLVTLQGTIGRVAITQYDCYVDRTLAIFTSYKIDINKKYFAHQLKAKFDLEKEYARGSTLKTITKEEFSEFKIPVPPVSEQARIVAILDKFEALTNSITEGLPREIELRQKQYAYYRDLLFSFPKPEEVAV